MNIIVKIHRNCDKPKKKNWGILYKLSTLVAMQIVKDIVSKHKQKDSSFVREYKALH